MANVTIQSMLQSIIEERPGLAKLATDQEILSYLKPVIEWKQQPGDFPFAQLLSTLIVQSVEKLYGTNAGEEAKEHLQKSWVIETGAHLHIPRRYNNVGRSEGPQINSLLFQGQVLWAMANRALGRTISLSLNSGRVPLDNTNSGAYLDLPALKLPITLASKKKHPDSPQSLIPARTGEEIQEKQDLLDMYLKQKTLPEDEYRLGQMVLENFQKVQSSFSDQVATSHALMMNTILPIKQITLDSELIGRDFIIALLKDKNSLTYSLFSDPERTKLFFDYMSDIRTGWGKDGSPFYYVSQKDEGFRLSNYNGDLSPETVVKGLESNTLWPTGIMKFFAFMAEGGLLPSGGWTQAGYCTETKQQSVKLLQKFNMRDRAEALERMPTHIVAVGPCWGLDEVEGDVQLLDSITTMLDKKIDFSEITAFTGNQTFQVAAPTLYEFLTGKQPSENYTELKSLLQFAFLKKD